MVSENAIVVKDVKKRFKVYLDKGHTMKEMVLFKKRRRYEERVVLDGISFSVKKGEAVGLIGHNGCGKSTTLKLLTRIIYPNSGSVELKGRVSSLIELGAGFHPDMSGRENIYINASIFGLTKQEIDRRLDDIITFSELEDFIDNPVRTYSSGMYMRLAFAVAINVDADILLIDEILAVGDASFQAKCFNKMREIKASGTTIVLVSHSLGQVEQICDRSIWINDGKIRMDGLPKDVHLEYMDYVNNKRKERLEKEQVKKEEKEEKDSKESGEGAETVSSAPSEEKPKEEKPAADSKRYGNRKAKITGIRFLDKTGKETKLVKCGETCRLEVMYAVSDIVEDAVFGIGFFRNDGMQCYGTNTRIDHIDKFNLSHEGTWGVAIEQLNLLPGQYWIDVAIESGDGIPVDYYKEAVRFEVVSGIADIGISRLQHSWKIGEKKDGETAESVQKTEGA